MKAILELLRRTMGLEGTTIGEATVERAIQARWGLLGLRTPEDYLAHLQADPGELDELIEAVVVPETWFFRDGMPFTALKRWALEEWLPKHPGGTLRVLTVPCSTGEEPYSVAMALLDAGLLPERFSVDAVDISRHAVARARRGVYHANSFRGKPLDFRERYFDEAAGEYTLQPAVRQQVRFETGNLLGPNFGEGRRYDVIFCRNLLIYFDRPTQQRAVNVLSNLLTTDGLFFAGHAEMGALAGGAFVPTEHAMSFSFRKTIPAARVAARTTIRFKTTRIVRTRVVRITARFLTPKPSAQRISPQIVMPPAAPKDPLAEAQRLADAGRLDEARRACEKFLQGANTSANGWYLLGVINDADGNRPRAAECYTKALYLQPDHHDALFQRALLAEQSGDHATAARLRERRQRAESSRSTRP